MCPITGIHLGDGAVRIQTSVINENCNQASCGLIAGGRSCLKFVKTATPVNGNKAKCSKMRYICVHITRRLGEKTQSQIKGGEDKDECDRYLSIRCLCRLLSALPHGALKISPGIWN